MSQENRPHEIATRTIVLDVPGTDAVVVVSHDIPYAVVGDERMTIDVYAPAGSARHEPVPAVIFVTGYSDEGARRILGCNLKDMASYVSWARLMAASGLAAITYTTRRPSTDVHSVLAHLRQHAASLGIDDERLGIWSCSGNVPNALSVLMEQYPGVKCAALCYGYTMDLDDATSVAEAATTFRFTNACVGRPIEDLPRDVPMFVARAGQDEMPNLNETLDRFITRAFALNLPVTATNHHTGPHAFDIVDDSDASRAVIRQIVTFMRFHLR
jgi:hypothetical protein